MSKKNKFEQRQQRRWFSRQPAPAPIPQHTPQQAMAQTQQQRILEQMRRLNRNIYDDPTIWALTEGQRFIALRDLGMFGAGFEEVEVEKDLTCYDYDGQGMLFDEEYAPFMECPLCEEGIHINSTRMDDDGIGNSVTVPEYRTTHRIDFDMEGNPQACLSIVCARSGYGASMRTIYLKEHDADRDGEEDMWDNVIKMLKMMAPHDAGVQDVIRSYNEIYHTTI